MKLLKERTLHELVDMLKDPSQTQTEGKRSVELQDIVYELKTSRLRHHDSAHTFCQEGGVHSLLRLLPQSIYPNSTLLFGLLGNLCALDKGCRDAIMLAEASTNYSNIVGPLNTDSHPDFINTTARLIANLATDHTHIPTLQSAGAVTAITNILTRGMTTNTCKRSLLRALRIFSSSPECREQVREYDGTAAIVECLQSQDSEVSVAALQTLQVLSQDLDISVTSLLCSKSTMQVIVRLCSHFKVGVRQSAMNLLLNSAKTSDGRVALSSAGGVEILVGFVETYIDNQSVLMEVVSATCLCCRDVISRQRLRDCGGLVRLTAMLCQDKFAGLHGNILSALVCYYFDEATLKVMVKEMWLLKALVSHLKVMALGEHMIPLDVSKPDIEQEMDTGEDSPLESVVEFDWSMGAPSSASPHALTSDPGDPDTNTSPQCLPLESSPEPMSPIPSEDIPLMTPPPRKRPRLELDLEGLTPLPSNFLDSLLSSPSPYKADRKPPDPLFSNEPSVSLDSQVILLLSRVSHLRDCLCSLSSPNILSAILEYFVSTDLPNTHVFKVLTRIFMNPHCFRDILLTLVPSKLFKHLQGQSSVSTAADSGGPNMKEDHDEQGHSKEIKFCPLYEELSNRLSKIAESPYGQGVLAHMLLRGGEREKQASCLSVPTLCNRSMRVCKKMMLSYGGFQELASLAMSDTKQDLQYCALESLLALAINSQKATPIKRRNCFTLANHVTLERSCDQILPVCRYLDIDHCPFDLTVVVHGPEGGVARVPLHKSVLTESSDVFRVMLQGSYSEADSSEVLLKDLPPTAFVSLVHYLYGCGWQCKDIVKHSLSRGTHTFADGLATLATRGILKAIASHSPPAGEEQTEGFEHCLWVLVCARRFLLTELSILCQHAAVKFVTPANVMDMFYFARIHTCYCLSESCVRVVMAMNYCQLRTEVFKDLLMSCEGEAVVDMLRLFVRMTE